MGFLPIFLDLASGRVILAGSGPKAIAKLQLLRSVGADVHWFAPHSDVAEELLLAGHYAGLISVTIGEPGETGARPIFSAADKTPGVYTIRLRVTDDEGQSVTRTATVRIIAPPSHRPAWWQIFASPLQQGRTR